MNALAPPKKARGELASKTRRKITCAEYAALALLASVFGAPFWFFEQRRGRLADQIDNGRDDS